MNGTPREPQAAAGSADGPSPQRAAAEVRAEMRTARDDERGDPRAEETLDEPGYGHGV